MLLISLFFIFGIFIVSLYQIKFHRRNSLLKKIPHPRKLPLLHNVLDFVGKVPEQMFSCFEEMKNDLGTVYQFTFDPFDDGAIIVSDPKVAEYILTSQKNLDKTEDYNFLVRWLGTGLLISTGKKWHQRRKIITPTFHFKILEQFAHIMNSQGEIFINNLKKFENKEFDIFPLINLYTLDVICESAMGCKINAQSKSESSYVKAVKEISTLIIARSFDPIRRFEFIYLYTEMYRKELKALKVLHGFSDEVIKSRRNHLLSTSNTDDGNENSNEIIGNKKRIALLDLLLQSTVDGKPLTDSDIREEVDTFMFEGHDTTTSGICFALYNIAKYPDIQKKVYEELKLMKENGYGRMTLQDLSHFHYLELVIKETLRLYPSVPYFGRRLSEEISTSGYVFPKRANVIISPYLMGRDPKIFSEPLEFRPERFEDNETTYDKKNPFSYVPFSAGSRNCIGQKFAILEMKSMIAKIIENYELKLAEGQGDVTLTLELVLKPKNGILLKINKRV